MTISVGDKLPDAIFSQILTERPENVKLGPKLAGRKVIIFGLPGAYTGTCTAAHVPSFIRSKDALTAKGIDEIICVSVNDAFVMKAWAASTGADEAGLTFLGDPASTFTTEIGLAFSAPEVGLINRSIRYAMLVDDSVLKVLNIEEQKGVCNMSGGEAMLDHL